MRFARFLKMIATISQEEKQLCLVSVILCRLVIRFTRFFVWFLSRFLVVTMMANVL